MDSSPASRFICTLAAVETVLTKHRMLQVEHLFLGLLKGCDLHREQFLTPVGSQAITWEDFEPGIRQIRSLLSECGIDTAKARHRLRRLLLGSDGGENGDFTGRCTDRVHEVLVAAEKRALALGDGAVQPTHILWAILREDIAVLKEAVVGTGGNWDPFQRSVEGKEGDPGNRTGQVATPSRRATSFLERFGRDLVAQARAGDLPPCIGRKEEMRAVAHILRRKTKNNPVLIGEPGVGKTCIVEGLAQRIADPEAPPAIRDWRIVEISMAMLVAGAMYQGQFEERLRQLIEEAAGGPNLILFMDEVHTMVAAGGGTGKGMDAAQILKPALARGDLRLIGATTTAEYRRFIEPDAALERRFQPVWVDEPTREDAIKILQGLRRGLESHHGVVIQDDAITSAVDWSMRYLSDHRLPDKALDLIDQACARRMLATLSPVNLFSEETIPASYSDPAQVTPEDVARILSTKCQIPLGAIQPDEARRLLGMEESLGQRVIGQAHAIEEVAEAIRTARSGLKDPKRPIGVFLLLGPTGTGKTELAKALAEFLFGTEEALIRLDMSEFAERHAVARLIGAPPGYVGHEEEGQLTGKVRTRPYSVLLLDEVEKAHPDVFDLFLQVFQDGQLTDSKGRKAVFSETLIILTSNLGSSSRAERRIGRIGFAPGASSSGGAVARDSEQMERLRQEIETAVKGFFRPEFLNRIDRRIVFHPLTQQVLLGILAKLQDRLNSRLKEKGVSIRLSDGAEAFLIGEGYSEEYGARELERVFERLVTNPIGRRIIDGTIRPGMRIAVDLHDQGLVFSS